MPASQSARISIAIPSTTCPSLETVQLIVKPCDVEPNQLPACGTTAGGGGGGGGGGPGGGFGVEGSPFTTLQSGPGLTSLASPRTVSLPGPQT